MTSSVGFRPKRERVWRRPNCIMNYFAHNGGTFCNYVWFFIHLKLSKYNKSNKLHIESNRCDTYVVTHKYLNLSTSIMLLNIINPVAMSVEPYYCWWFLSSDFPQGSKAKSDKYWSFTFLVSFYSFGISNYLYKDKSTFPCLLFKTINYLFASRYCTLPSISLNSWTVFLRAL